MEAHVYWKTKFLIVIIIIHLLFILSLNGQYVKEECCFDSNDIRDDSYVGAGDFSSANANDDSDDGNNHNINNGNTSTKIKFIESLTKTRNKFSNQLKQAIQLPPSYSTSATSAGCLKIPVKWNRLNGVVRNKKANDGNEYMLLHCDNMSLDLVNRFMLANSSGNWKSFPSSTLLSSSSPRPPSSADTSYEKSGDNERNRQRTPTNGTTTNNLNNENSTYGNRNVSYSAIIFTHINYDEPNQKDSDFRWPFVRQTNNPQPWDQNLIVWNENTTEYFSWIKSELTSDQISKIIQSKGNLFSKLISLDFSYNNIRELTNQMFTNLTNLLALDLSDNRIETNLIDGNAFQAMTQLKRLNLSKNQLTSIVRGQQQQQPPQTSGIFGNLSELQELDLSYNRITDLPRNAFNGLQQLRCLNLSNNELSIIPFQAFHMLKNIEHLDLSSNQLISFLDNFFIDNRQLKVLQIQNNTIEHLSDNSLFGLEMLQYLDISRNRLLSIESHALTSLASLQVFDLSHNNISALSTILFNGLNQLKYVNLSKTELRLLPDGIFASQSKLEELIIDETALLKLGNWVSRQGKIVNKNILANLRRLSISNNRHMHDIEPVFFQNTPALIVLKLSGNGLSLLPHEISELTELQHLDISNNDLISLPREINTLTNLRSLSLIGNNYTCDCHMMWLIDWIAKFQKQTNFNSSYTNNSAYPAPLNELSNLKCRYGYPGDFLRVLQQLHCHAPVIIKISENTTHLLRSDVQLECLFNGYPVPDVIWITPLNKIIRYHADPDAKPFSANEIETNGNSSRVLAELRHHVKNREKMEHRMFQGKPPNFIVPTEIDGITLLDNGSLRIHNVMREDSGLYSCHGYNIMGHATGDIRLCHINSQFLNKPIIQLILPLQVLH